MRTVWNRFFVNIINGIVILLPVVITMALIKFLAGYLNHFIIDPIMKMVGPSGRTISHVYAVKGVIFITVILALALIGWGAKILVVNRIFSLGERILLKVPIMGRIYNAAKQIASAFIGQGKTIFKQVVLLEYPRKGLYSVGFTTGFTRGEIKDSMGRDLVNVFVPTTPNPTSGVFLIVPRDDVHFLKMSVEEGMKLIISGGSVSPPRPGQNV